jgi:hypothetical protein
MRGEENEEGERFALQFALRFCLKNPHEGPKI